MAAFLHFLLLLCSFAYNFNISQSKSTPPQQKGPIFHVSKDSSTLQYLTQIHHGTPLQPTNLVLDLGGPSIWLGFSADTSSTTQTPISRSSIKCLSANSNTQKSKSGMCVTFPENRITQMATLGNYTNKQDKRPTILILSDKFYLPAITSVRTMTRVAESTRTDLPGGDGVGGAEGEEVEGEAVEGRIEDVEGGGGVVGVVGERLHGRRRLDQNMETRERGGNE